MATTPKRCRARSLRSATSTLMSCWRCCRNWHRATAWCSTCTPSKATPTKKSANYLISARVPASRSTPAPASSYKLNWSASAPQPAMSANPLENNSTPKTTGSLEELFRHHLGEEAAVPPRPMLWDQIDNSLLIRQNEQYRRRLVATRWVAAASLLLATLAGTGWWAGRTGLVGSPEMATVNSPAANGQQQSS